MMVLNDTEVNAVKNMISNYNSRFPTCMHIKEKDVFVEDEKETIKNIFKLLTNYKYDYSYLHPEFKCRIIRKLARKMFKLRMITAYQCIKYENRYNMSNYYSLMEQAIF